jgi:hypothetical protein
VKEGVEKTLAENIISDSNENNILNSKSGIQSSSSRGKNRNVEIQHHHHQSPATSQNESSPADNFENINENSEEGKAAEAGVKAPQYQRL